MVQISEIFAKNLKALRDQRGWTQSDLANASGVSLEQIKKLETEKSWVSTGSIQHLARAFGCPEADLFRDPNATPKPTLQEAWSLISEAIEAVSVIPPSAMKALQSIDWQNKNIEAWLKAGAEGFKKEPSSKKNTA